MKNVLVICMLLAAAFVRAGDKTAPSSDSGDVVTGRVAEVQDVQNYTYLLLETEQGETWAAVPSAKVTTGATVTIENAVVMDDFQSSALGKTFKTIVFGMLRTAPPLVVAAHSNVAGSTRDAEDIQVSRAIGADACAVAEIMANPGSFKDKPVVIRGKVVKYNAGIMGMNWIHLRDGSGSASDQTNDVLITTTEDAKVGDIVTVKGVVRTDKDFGAGYSYKAIVEDATLRP